MPRSALAILVKCQGTWVVPTGRQTCTMAHVPVHSYPMPALAWRLALACTLLRVGADAQNTCSVCESETTGAAEGVYWPLAGGQTPHAWATLPRVLPCIWAHNCRLRQRARSRPHWQARPPRRWAVDARAVSFHLRAHAPSPRTVALTGSRSALQGQCAPTRLPVGSRPPRPPPHPRVHRTVLVRGWLRDGGARRPLHGYGRGRPRQRRLVYGVWTSDALQRCTSLPVQLCRRAVP